jgi:hypothetical protein
LPQADGVQAVSADDPQVTPVPQAQREDGASWPQFILYGVLVIVSLVLFAVAATTLWWMLHAWRSPDALAATGFRRRSARGPRSFSLLLPARHEQYVLGDTIDALARLDHPAVRVADMRREPPADHIEFVRIDGTASGSLHSDAAANPSGYRTMPAGTYVMMTVGDPSPKLRLSV